MHQDLMQLSSYHDKKVEVIWGEKEVQKLQFQQSTSGEMSQRDVKPLEGSPLVSQL